MIYTGENEISGIYLGGDEIPAIYVGEEQIYPMNLGTLTGISITELTWVNDVPYSGGTASVDNCTIKVMGLYDSGRSRNITKLATIAGSITASASTSTERVDLGLLTITATYEGFTATGSVEAYQEANHYDQYFTIKVTSPGAIVWYAESAATTFKAIQYSMDSGSTWTSITSAKNGASYIDVVAGDVVMFKGENTGYGGSAAYTSSNFSTSTAGMTVEGNTMSLLYGDNFTGQTVLPSEYTFRGFFTNCTGLTDAENLILPAPVCTRECYRNMFAATRISTAVPKLPAMTLARACYTNMFIGCNTLETAPDLPAPTLVQDCYSGMLYMQSGKTLRYIKCLATNLSASGALTNFHHSSNISPTGVFVKYPGATWASGGTSGIPNGWTIIEATE